MSQVELRKVQVQDIYELRRDILRAGAPIESVHFAGDQDKDTLHLALYYTGKLIGCATLTCANSHYFEEDLQYQLRGMAIDTPYQRSGYGTALLRYAEYMALSRGVSRVWCNARTHAIDFYAKEGYCCYGDAFMIPNVCEHIVMGKVVEYHSCCEGNSCRNDCDNCKQNCQGLEGKQCDTCHKVE